MPHIFICNSQLIAVLPKHKPASKNKQPNRNGKIYAAAIKAVVLSAAWLSWWHGRKRIAIILWERIAAISVLTGIKAWHIKKAAGLIALFHFSPLTIIIFWAALIC